jgi:hypothetical protein
MWDDDSVAPFNHLYIIQAQTFEYETNYDLILRNILDARFLMHFVSSRCPSKASILDFVHHHFWLKTFTRA